MNTLFNVTNAADLRAVAQTNFEKLDGSLAFTMQPTKVDGEPTEIIGPPTSGDWSQFALWVDAKLGIFRCEESGTPGAWVQVGAAIVSEEFAGATDKYLIQVPAENWAFFYYDQGTDTWKPVFLTPE